MHRENYSSTLFLNWEHSFLKMFSILERNGEKRKVKLSLFSNFVKVYTTDWTYSLFVEIYNVYTANSIWFEQNNNIFNFKNVVLFLRTCSTQMRTSEFSLCGKITGKMFSRAYIHVL